MGDRIRDRLDASGRSQRELADLVGIKQPSLNKVIKARNGESTKHVVAIAKHLGVTAEWLELGTGEMVPQPRGEAILVGYIGAGEKVYRTDEGSVLQGGLQPPAGYQRALAARIRGTSMHPLEPGWLVFYEAEYSGDANAHINKLCAVGLEDGSTFIKKLRKSRGKWRLESWSPDVPPIENASVIWASPILEIRLK